MHSFDHTVHRRGFLARLAALGAPLALLGAGAPLHATEIPMSRDHDGQPDERWLDRLTAKHRVVFDVEAHKNGHALGQARSFLDAYRDVYHVPERDVNLVLGVRGSGIPLVLSDALWARYRLGEQYGITDPATGKPATRNLYVRANVQPNGPVAPEATIEALQARGVVVLVCNNTVQGAARTLSAKGLGTADEVRAAILDGILPGVMLVPAMVIAFSRMQERGIGYVYAG